MRISIALLVSAVLLVSGTANAVGFASPPTVVTGVASNIGPTSATVAGTVNPQGLATTYSFEYGKTTSYGSKTASKSAGSGTTTVAVTSTISSLSPGTTYHYRISATSTAGTSKGADRTFTTTPPPTVVTGSASNIGPTSATVAGTVNPQGLATTYSFEYGKTTSYGSKTASKSAGSGTSTVGVTATISSLSPGTTYHYRISATSAAGTSKGADRTFTTTRPPTVVTGVASNIEPTSATVAGTVNPQGLATTYLFEYGKTTSYSSKTASTSAGSGTSTVGVTATIPSLSPGTTYHYRISATSAAGTSKGADRSFKTGTQSITIANVRRTVVYGRSTTLSGTASSQHAGETVSVLAQPFGATAFSSIATVSTTTGGSWTYAARPMIGTTYKVQWQTAASGTVTIQVRPRISVRVVRGVFYVNVAAARSLAGRVVYFQRRSFLGQWVSRKKLVLNARSAKRFRAKLPHGRSRLRVFMPQAQAGPGYLAGFSRVLVIRRR
ncbi:MAG: fibronectin type III domain-containing protein [Actinobacteria bacterium]|nr:MAG: fibronectin type III domain-containing protein [Actinomycetota bacterium]